MNLLSMPRRLLLLALALPLAAVAQARYNYAGTPTLLPKSVRPLHIDLALDLDPAKDDFGGRAAITLRVDEAQPAIVLHAEHLEPRRAQLDGRALSVQADAERKTWTLAPEDGRPVAAGEHRLVIDYRGRVATSGEGLFRVDHRIAGQPARMLATQLEAISARRVLPLFDEPVFRTAFTLTVRAPAGDEVLSNMPRTAQRRFVDAVEHRFARTPSMPSYLLAVAVGRFERLEGRHGKVPLAIVFPPGKREQARFAMASTKRLLPYFEDYFGQPYALPKLDQLAVPGTRQGAMEDWGLISYVEDLLLVDPRTSPPWRRQLVFEIVAHELAHQWFGNLVSVASWNEIWLNEAFATWMQDKATERFHPEWQNELQTRRSLDATMDRDATATTRAIRSGPVSEAAVFSVFDNITYNKGGAVLSMLEQWLGADAFRRGLRGYMAERRMQPATAGDLWHHLGRAAGQPGATAVAASWTDQPGVPLVGVRTRCEAGATVVTLTQSRFSLGDALPPLQWRIPVRLARGAERRTVLLDGPELDLRWPGCDAKPIQANAGGRGYYRVEYAPDLRRRLAQALPRLVPADRAALLSDSYALARAGRLTMAEHFALLAALPSIADAGRAPLYAQALGQFALLDEALDGTPSQPALREAAKALFAPELARLGWQPAAGESNEVQTLRGRLVAALARWGDEAVLAEARQRFGAALQHRGIVPSLRAPVLRAVGAQARPAEYDALLAALRAADSEEERHALVDALAEVRDPALARRLLDESLAGRVPADVAVRLPGEVGAQPVHAAMAYAFVLEHWEALAALAGDGVFGGRHWLLPQAASGSTDADQPRRLAADQRRLAGEAGMPAAERTAGRIGSRVRLREREAEALGPALAGWKPWAQRAR